MKKYHLLGRPFARPALLTLILNLSMSTMAFCDGNTPEMQMVEHLTYRIQQARVAKDDANRQAYERTLWKLITTGDMDQQRFDYILAGSSEPIEILGERHFQIRATGPDAEEQAILDRAFKELAESTQRNDILSSEDIRGFIEGESHHLKKETLREQLSAAREILTKATENYYEKPTDKPFFIHTSRQKYGTMQIDDINPLENSTSQRQPLYLSPYMGTVQYMTSYDQIEKQYIDQPFSKEVPWVKRAFIYTLAGRGLQDWEKKALTGVDLLSVSESFSMEANFVTLKDKSTGEKIKVFKGETREKARDAWYQYWQKKSKPLIPGSYPREWVKNRAVTQTVGESANADTSHPTITTITSIPADVANLIAAERWVENPDRETRPLSKNLYADLVLTRILVAISKDTDRFGYLLPFFKSASGRIVVQDAIDKINQDKSPVGKNEIPELAHGKYMKPSAHYKAEFLADYLLEHKEKYDGEHTATTPKISPSTYKVDEQTGFVLSELGWLKGTGSAEGVSLLLLGGEYKDYIDRKFTDLTRERFENLKHTYGFVLTFDEMEAALGGSKTVSETKTTITSSVSAADHAEAQRLMAQNTWIKDSRGRIPGINYSREVKPHTAHFSVDQVIVVGKEWAPSPEKTEFLESEVGRILIQTVIDQINGGNMPQDITEAGFDLYGDSMASPGYNQSVVADYVYALKKKDDEARSTATTTKTSLTPEKQAVADEAADFIASERWFSNEDTWPPVTFDVNRVILSMKGYERRDSARYAHLVPFFESDVGRFIIQDAIGKLNQNKSLYAKSDFPHGNSLAYRERNAGYASSVLARVLLSHKEDYDEARAAERTATTSTAELTTAPVFLGKNYQVIDDKGQRKLVYKTSPDENGSQLVYEITKAIDGRYLLNKKLKKSKTKTHVEENRMTWELREDIWDREKEDFARDKGFENIDFTFKEMEEALG